MLPNKVRSINMRISDDRLSDRTIRPCEGTFVISSVLDQRKPDRSILLPDPTMTPAPVLTAADITQRLTALAGWSRAGDSITKTFRFATFPDGIACIARVADIAETQQHHPDIDIRYTAVTFTLSTHDSGGITEKDFVLAGEIEKCAG